MQQDSKWGEFVKPALWDLMKTLRIDIRFHRASGDYMYYNGRDGKEVEVLDLAGGMGATLLGHNHPELKDVKRNYLNNDLPLHSQGSLREESGMLGEMLNKYYPGKEKRNVVFTNSGTETIECALKHAEFNRVLKLQNIAKKLFRNVREIREYYRLHSGAALPKEYTETGIDVLIGDIINQARELSVLQPIVIAAERSFHGKTTGSVRITGNPAYREAFGLLSGIDVKFVEFNNLAALEEVLRDSFHTIKFLERENGKILIREEKFLNVAAFILEPVQGEGGIHVATTAYMKGIETLKNKYGFEWMLDDIQSGMGRTGKLFSIEHYPINPDSIDYIIMSKALGGALCKIGAMLVRSSIHDPRFGILHTSTFAEDGESALVGLKTIEIITRDRGRLLSDIRRKGDRFLRKLNSLKTKYPGIIKDVRGMGLMIGIEFTLLKDNSSLFFSRSAQQGVLGSVLAGYLLHEHKIRTAPPLNSLVSHKPYNVMRIEPSAYISTEEIDNVIKALDRAFEIISKCNAYEFSKFVAFKESPGKNDVIKDFSKSVVPYKKDPAFKNARRMTFLIHPLNIDQVMEEFDPSLDGFGKERDPETGVSEREAFWDTIVPLMDAFVFKEVNVKSPRTGDRVNAKFIGFLYTTRQMNALRKTDPQKIVGAVQKAVDLGAKLGGDICGLGAFTSIVTHNGTALDDTYINVTSGNSYTTALIWQSILRAAEFINLDLNTSVGAVVGAAGNIGSVTANLLSENIPKIYLVGKSRPGALNDLRQVAETIYSDTVDIIRSAKPDDLQGLPAVLSMDLLAPLAALNNPELKYNTAQIDNYIESRFKGTEKKIAHLLKSIFYRRPDENIGSKIYEAVALKHGKDPFLIPTLNIRQGVKDADVVVSAVSADTEIIKTSWIKAGAIVNDVSLPPSMSLKLYNDRPDVLAIQGGIGHLPEYLDLGIPGLAVGATLGCMAETFILTMMNMIDNYSFGNITKQQVVKIWEAGKILGFGLAAIKYKDTKLTRDVAASISRK